METDLSWIRWEERDNDGKLIAIRYPGYMDTIPEREEIGLSTNYDY